MIPFKQNLLGSIRPFLELIQLFVLGAGLCIYQPTTKYIYISLSMYIYIYMCVCMCVCVCVSQTDMESGRRQALNVCVCGAAQDRASLLLHTLAAGDVLGQTQVSYSTLCSVHEHNSSASMETKRKQRLAQGKETRSNSLTLPKSRCRLNPRRSFVSEHVAATWNSHPDL